MELQTGISPDRQDVLIVSAGGKGPVADLAGFLRELGADWRVFFDWDATESTHLPLFQNGLTPGYKAALAAAANTLLGKTRILPTRDSKTAKLLNSMLKELGVAATAATAPVATPAPVAAPAVIAPVVFPVASTAPVTTAFAATVTPVAPAASAALAPGAAPVSGAKASILDVFIRRNTLLLGADIAALQRAIIRHQHQAACRILSPKGIWLWSGTIEEVILRTPAAEIDAEAFLRARGSLKQNFANPSALRPALINLLHNSAYEPELVRDVVEHLWKQRHFDHSEIKRATHFVVR